MVQWFRRYKLKATVRRSMACHYRSGEGLQMDPGTQSPQVKHVQGDGRLIAVHVLSLYNLP